jgi:hypothetical protein
MSQIREWAVTIGTSDICQWIIDKGGYDGLVTQDIYGLIISFNSDPPTPPNGYSFIPTSKEIYGCIMYWNGNVSGGNTNTNCNFG